jgi:hypothetical protein
MRFRSQSPPKPASQAPPRTVTGISNHISHPRGSITTAQAIDPDLGLPASRRFVKRDEMQLAGISGDGSRLLGDCSTRAQLEQDKKRKNSNHECPLSCAG